MPKDIFYAGFKLSAITIYAQKFGYSLSKNYCIKKDAEKISAPFYFDYYYS